MKHLSLICFFLPIILGFSDVFGRWQAVEGLNGGHITGLAAGEKNFFAMVDKGGPYVLACLNSSRWEPINFEPDGIKRIWADDKAIFAASDSKIFLSRNKGKSWKKISFNDRLPNKAVAAGENIIFLSEEMLYLSRDDGDRWATSRGNRVLSRFKEMVDIAVDDSLIVVIGRNNNICRSLNYGISWKKIGQPDEAVTLYAVAVKNGYILVNANNGLYCSSDMGSTWKRLYALSDYSNHQSITDIALGENYMLIATDKGIFSSGAGKKWKKLNLNSADGECLLVKGDTVLAGGKNGIFISPDKGITWGEFNLGLENVGVSALYSDNGRLFVGTKTGNILFFNPDSGWEKTRKTGGQKITALVANDSNIYAATKSGYLLNFKNKGRRWQGRTLGRNGFLPLTFSAADTEIFLGGKNGVYFLAMEKVEMEEADAETSQCQDTVTSKISSVSQKNNRFPINYRKEWQRADSGIDQFRVTGLLRHSWKLYAGTDSGFFFSHDKGKSWNKKSDVAGLKNLTMIRNNAMFATQDPSGYLLVSGDGGRSWRTIKDLPKTNCLASAGYNFIFAGTERGVFYSSGYGRDWTDFSSGLSRNMEITSLAVLGGNIYCGTDGYGVWRRSLSELTGMEIPSQKKYWPYFFSVYKDDQKIRVDFSISNTSNVSLSLYAVHGQKEIYSVENRFPAGEYSIPGDIAFLAEGIYFCQLKTDKDVVMIKKFFFKK